MDKPRYGDIRTLGGGVNMNFFMLAPGATLRRQLQTFIPMARSRFQNTNQLTFTGQICTQHCKHQRHSSHIGMGSMFRPQLAFTRLGDQFAG